MTTSPPDQVADAIRYLADQLTSAIEAHAQGQQSMTADMLARMTADRDEDQDVPLP